MCMFCFLFSCFRVVFFRCSDRANFFLNALVLCFYLEHVQRITFCRCFLISNQAVFCVNDGVVLWLKIKKSYYYYLYSRVKLLAQPARHSPSGLLLS